MKRLVSKLALGLIIATAAVTTAGAQSTEIRYPQTPAGKAVEAYFKAFNAGEEAMKAFFSDFSAMDALRKTPLDMRLDRYRQMRGRLQSLEPQKLADARDNFVSVVAKTGAGEFVRLDFEFEAAAPFGLQGIRIEDMEGGGGQGPRPEPKKDDAELVASVREYARRAVETGEFSGVILIARNGKPFFEEAFGEADREKKIPNRTDTKFNVGSIDKTFTGLAIRQLAAEKKLALDDGIGKYLPGYPNKDAAAKVTIRHLLEMTSGIGDFFGDRYEIADKEKIVTLADYLPLFADKPLEFEPGTANKYSNGGYVVLGLITEKVAGTDYYAYVRDHIFKPAGMPDSGWSEKAVRLPGLAVGYERDGSTWKTNYDTLPGKGSSAGGGYSTARDLLNYTVALDKGVFGAAGESERGGFGIAGGAPGLNAAVEWDPRRGVTIVVMANLSPPSATAMARQILSWLPR